MYYDNKPLLIRNISFNKDNLDDFDYNYYFTVHICECIERFFYGELKEIVFKEAVPVSFYLRALNSPKISDAQKLRLESFNFEFIRLVCDNFLPTSRYSELKSKDVVIFGCGCYGQKLRNMLETHEIAINCFIDNNKAKQGEIVDDIPVIDPKKLSDINGKTIIISPAGSFGEIYYQLIQLGATNEQIFIL